MCKRGSSNYLFGVNLQEICSASEPQREIDNLKEKDHNDRLGLRPSILRIMNKGIEARNYRGLALCLTYVEFLAVDSIAFFFIVYMKRFHSHTSISMLPES